MRRKKTYMATAALAMAAVMSCTTTRRIETAHRRAEATANIRQPQGKEKEMPADTASIMPEMIKFTDKEGREMTVMNSVLDTVTGNYELAVSLGEVTVVSKSRILPERGGIITLPFVITIPKQFMESDWRIAITPTLHNQGEATDLQPVVVTGILYRRVRDRETSYEEKELERALRREEKRAGRMELFGDGRERAAEQKKILDEYVRALREESKGWILDSITDGGRQFEYHYRQEFRTEDFARRLRLTIAATVEDMALERHTLPGSDTLTYILSSMTQFMDRSTRYVRETVMRKVTESTRAYITFPVAGRQVIDSLGDNAREIARVRTKMEEINNGNEFVIDSVIIRATSSPEGSAALNRELSEARGKALRERLSDVLSSNAEAQALVQVRAAGEDWEGLYERLARGTLRDKAEIMSLIRSVQGQDEREAMIRERYPEAYSFMRDSIYPSLRAVDFTFHLSRRGMVEDVMYTDVPDEEYARALVLMDEHRYTEAMPKMLEYRDLNAAICYMSLGYDTAALNILQEQEEDADISYLKAILLSRLGRTEEAVASFIRSCQADPAKMDRGELDPEISKLINAYHLSDMVFE